MEYRAGSGELVTDRLILRKLREEDAPAVMELMNDEEVTKSTHSLGSRYTLDTANEWIARHQEDFETGGFIFFAVTDRSAGGFCGFICLNFEKRDNRGELGYAYARSCWGKGIATEATQAVIDFAFGVRKMHKVYARHFASNPASGRVMQKCGMTFEGLQLSHDFKNGRYEDVLSYGILNPGENA